jgi:DNA replication protein DnaC
MNDEMTSILEALANMPGDIAEGLKAAAERAKAYIAVHGVEAYEQRLAEHRRREIEEYDRERAKRASLIRLKNSGFGETIDDVKAFLAEYTFDTFNTREEWQKKMLEKCRQFLAQDEHKWLYISGQPGCGKTHLGTAVCGELLAKGKPTRYMTHRELINTLIASQNDEDYYDIVREYGTVEVLYLDDFFKPVKNDRGDVTRPTAAEVKHTFEVLNMRLVRNGITIITSERSLMEICDIDEALGSRIKQKCGKYTMDILRKPGRNYRMRDIERI